MGRDKPPRTSASERADQELAAAALRKRREGKTPTARELRALKRIEATRDQALRDHHYASITKGDWSRWSGRQHKTLNEQAERYGLPIGEATINLPDVVKWLHDFLATHAHALATAGEEDDGPTDPELRAAKLDNIRERTRLSRIEADRKEGVLLPRDQVHQVYAAIAGVLRQASETLQKRFGTEAYEILADALSTADEHIEEIVGGEGEPAAEETPPGEGGDAL